MKPLHEDEAVPMPSNVSRALLARCTIAKHLGVAIADTTDDARLIQDLGADSLDVVQLTVLLEETFNTAITDDEMGECSTVGEVVALIERKCG